MTLKIISVLGGKGGIGDKNLANSVESILDLFALESKFLHP